jgi:hypothetical protein
MALLSGSFGLKSYSLILDTANFKKPMVMERFSSPPAYYDVVHLRTRDINPDFIIAVDRQNGIPGI